ncbi:MAG: SH3 domain-containing protein [Anaerolineae bacterium]|nr:SH3 domain-containing protein [Anaerolineae bacterium]
MPTMVQAQPRITDTPLPVVIPQNTAPPTSLSLLTPTPSFTPTPEAPLVTLEAAAPAADINVRDFPDVTCNRLGSLDLGQQYPVTGVYFQWYQFEYAASPTGRAWVFADLVTINGDQATIPAVDPNVQPTAESPEDIGTATAAALLLTPEIAESATAQARILTLPADEVRSGDGFLPTFTPPPDIAVRRPTEVISDITPTPEGGNIATQFLNELDVPTSLPPIVPIAGLIGVGVLGLFVASIRR